MKNLYIVARSLEREFELVIRFVAHLRLGINVTQITTTHTNPFSLLQSQLVVAWLQSSNFNWTNIITDLPLRIYNANYHICMSRSF
jgi:hypothetical protein